jgi:NIL domain
MSSLSSTKSQEKVLHSIDINIPPQLHQEPVLATLISNYDLIVNFKAAVLDRKATGGGWFNLSLEGYPQDIDNALNYLRNLEIAIFAHNSVPIVNDPAAQAEAAPTEEKSPI